MGKSTTTSTDVLNSVFTATAFSWNAIGNLYISLHTADPTVSGTQTTSEANYTSYARVSVVRTAGGWTVSGNQVSNAALIQFPQCGGGNNTITYVAIGTLTSGAGQILYSGVLNSSLAVSNLIQPQFSIGSLVVQEL